MYLKQLSRCDGDDDGGNGDVSDTVCNYGRVQITDKKPKKGRVTGLIPWPTHGPCVPGRKVPSRQRRVFLKQEP